MTSKAYRAGARYEVEVRPRLDSQGELKNDAFACSVSESMPGIQVGDQVRIRRNDSHYALYTVRQRRASDAYGIVRMGKDGRERVGTSQTFAAFLSRPVSAIGLTDAQAQVQNEFVERLSDDGTQAKLAVLAPHGGMIERNTDRQAEATALALSCSSWICKGFKAGGGCWERWHISSSRLSTRSFPGLTAIRDRGFANAVSFHGMDDAGVFVGGAAPYALRQAVKNSIKERLSGTGLEVRLAPAGSELSGASPYNVVNGLLPRATVASRSNKGPTSGFRTGRRSRTRSSQSIRNIPDHRIHRLALAPTNRDVDVLHLRSFPQRPRARVDSLPRGKHLRE